MTGNPLAPKTDARVALMTPDARGAVAVLRVRGGQALAVADSMFRQARGSRLALSAPAVPRFGRIGAGAGDEVVALVIDTGRGIPDVEVQCHGGPAPVALVVAALVAAGAEQESPLAYLRHAARSLVEAEAWEDLSRAPTLRTAEILLEQAQGALERAILDIRGLVATDPARALADVETLLKSCEVGLRLVDGWTVALAGRPNVGKSRLLNAIAGYDRAIVDPLPGTTRDVVTVRTAFDGWPVEVADTAGLRAAEDPTEAAGVALARLRQVDSDLTVLVLDRSEPLTALDRTLLFTLRGRLIVANKTDLPSAWEPHEVDHALALSAQRGDGLDKLAETIARTLVPEPPPTGAAVPFRVVHKARLVAVRDALRSEDLPGASAGLGAMLSAE